MDTNIAMVADENFDAKDLVIDTSDQQPADDVQSEQEKPLSKKEQRELKLAYERALQQRKEAVKRNKELIADKQLEVSYWKAEADLLRYRFEKMDFYLKNIEIEPKYLQASEEQRARQNQNQES